MLFWGGNASLFVICAKSSFFLVFLGKRAPVCPALLVHIAHKKQLHHSIDAAVFLLLIGWLSSSQFLGQLAGCEHLLFAGCHILECDGSFGHLLLAYDSYKRYAVAVGMAHLFLHLVAAGEELG